MTVGIAEAQNIVPNDTSFVNPVSGPCAVSYLSAQRPRTGIRA